MGGLFYLPSTSFLCFMQRRIQILCSPIRERRGVGVGSFHVWPRPRNAPITRRSIPVKQWPYYFSCFHAIIRCESEWALHNFEACLASEPVFVWCVHARQAWQMAPCKMYDMRLRERQNDGRCPAEVDFNEMDVEAGGSLFRDIHSQSFVYCLMKCLNHPMCSATANQNLGLVLWMCPTLCAPLLK